MKRGRSTDGGASPGRASRQRCNEGEADGPGEPAVGAFAAQGVVAIKGEPGVEREYSAAGAQGPEFCGDGGGGPMRELLNAASAAAGVLQQVGFLVVGSR